MPKISALECIAFALITVVALACLLVFVWLAESIIYDSRRDQYFAEAELRGMGIQDAEILSVSRRSRHRPIPGLVEWDYFAFKGGRGGLVVQGDLICDRKYWMTPRSSECGLTLHEDDDL